MWQRERPYTVGSEHKDLGKILFQMMTGKRYPRDKECIMDNCDCYHVDPPEGVICPHHCALPEFRFGDYLERMKGRYTKDLVQFVGDLLSTQRDTYPATDALYERAFREYQQWKGYTREGRAHVDHYDDLLERKTAAWRKEMGKHLEGLRAVMSELARAGVDGEAANEAIAAEETKIEKVLNIWKEKNELLIEYEE